MKRFFNRQINSNDFIDRDTGSVFSGFHFSQCYFQGVSVSLAKMPELRSVIRDVEIVNCSQRGSVVCNPYLENVLVQNLNTNGQILHSYGAAFKQVVLKGRIDRLVIHNDIMPSPLEKPDYRKQQIALFNQSNAQYYKGVDWALDISNLETFEINIRGIPAKLIRRDPDTQVVIGRQAALKGEWRNLPFSNSALPFSIDLFLKREDEDLVLVAPRLHENFDDYVNDLKLLRYAGIAEPD